MTRNEILFTGSGGQGVITASIILAEAAALHEGKHVVQSQSYGPEARGGRSSANVIINEIEVGYPKVIQPHVMVCLTQEALDHFAPKLRPGGLLLVDCRFVRRIGQRDARLFCLPMYDTVVERVNLPVTFNICMLGALAGLSKVVRPDSLRRAVESRVPARFLEPNLEALELGFELAKNAEPARMDGRGQPFV